MCRVKSPAFIKNRLRHRKKKAEFINQKRTFVTLHARNGIRHSKRLTNAMDILIFNRQTNTATAAFVWHAQAFVPTSVLDVTLHVRYDTRAKRRACDMARVSNG